MNAGRDVERLIADWLVEESPRRAPDRILGHASDRIDHTQQRLASRVPWRNPVMNRYLLPVAAVLIVVIGAAVLLFRPTSNVGPGLPSPSPLPTSTAAPSVTEAPVPTPLPIRETDSGRTLVPGTYHVGFFAAPFEVELGGGWTVGDAMPNNVVFRNGSNTFLTLVVMDGVYPDPCHIGAATTPVGTTTDGLVGALAAMAGFEVRDLRDVNLFRTEAKAFTLSNSIDPAADGCSNPEVLTIGTFKHEGSEVGVLMGAPADEPLWVVEVDGKVVLIGGPREDVEALDFDGVGLQPIGAAPDTGGGVAGPIPNGVYQLDVAMTDIQAAIGVPIFTAAERNVLTQSLGIGVGSTLTLRVVVSTGTISIEHAVDRGSLVSDGTWPTPEVEGGLLGVKYNPTVLGHVFTYTVEWNTDRSAFRLSGGGTSPEVGPVARFMFVRGLGMGEFTRVG